MPSQRLFTESSGNALADIHYHSKTAAPTSTEPLPNRPFTDSPTFCPGRGHRDYVCGDTGRKERLCHLIHHNRSMSSERGSEQLLN